MLLACWAGPVAALTPHQEARALLDRWLQAQNEGRFDEYQTLYGEGFEGVRRSGNRTAHFDRAGWLQDRKRMFEKPMTVVAENVHIYASARAGRIVFTQRWSSGHYTDTGPKQLVLRHGPDGFRIDREELFASDRSEPGTIDLEAFHRFAFVVDGEVVVTMQAEDRWGKDPPRIEKRGKDRMLVLDDRGPAQPRLILRNQPDGEMFLKPTAAVDVDGDGTAALLFDSSTDYGSVNASGQFDYLEHGIVSLLDGVYVRIVGPQTPIYGCPC